MGLALLCVFSLALILFSANARRGLLLLMFQHPFKAHKIAMDNLLA